MTNILQNYETNQSYLVTCDPNPKIPFKTFKAEGGEKCGFVCGKSELDAIASDLTDVNLLKLEKKAIPLTGPGRLLILEQSLSLSKAVDTIKIHLGLKHVRLAVANNATIGRLLWRNAKYIAF